jgi:hypothetical protein
VHLISGKSRLHCIVGREFIISDYAKFVNPLTFEYKTCCVAVAPDQHVLMLSFINDKYGLNKTDVLLGSHDEIVPRVT